MPTTVDWNVLLDEYGPMVVGISWRILGHAADVEDNVQETFLDAFRYGQRQKIAYWGGLLRRLATCGALARLRRRRSHLPLDAETAASSQPSPEDQMAQGELQAALRQAVAELPEREGAVFSLRYFEGLSLDEIAEVLAIKYSAAGAALSRARSKLERVFEDFTVENKP